jgi:hypothetical protein
MCLLYLRTKFHLSVSDGSLAVAMKPKTEVQLCYNFTRCKIAQTKCNVFLLHLAVRHFIVLHNRW